MSKKYWLGLLAAVALLLFFGNSGLQITDNVESNYALTAKEMVLSGDWVSPQIYGRYWYDKPVFFYWLTALGFKLFGFNEFAARFFPAVCGVGTVALAGWAGTKLFNERAGFISALVLGTSLEFFLISKLIITDAALLLFFSGALVCFYLGHSTPEKRYYYGTYACCALATLTKGPIGFLLPGLILCLYFAITKGWAQLKEAKLFSGTLLFLAIMLPWYYAMYSIHGTDFTNVFLGTHNLLRATVSEHPKDNVFYYYTAVAIIALFPWIGFVPGMLLKLFREGGKWLRPSSLNIFLLLWAATVFIFFQCMATKYLTYTYPMLFPMALLLGSYLDQGLQELNFKYVLGYNFVFNMLLAVAAYLVTQRGVLAFRAPYLFVIVAVAGLAAGLYYHRKDKGKTLLAIGACTLCFNLLLIANGAIDFSATRSAKAVAQVLKLQYADAKVIDAAGDYPTSSVFYSDRRVNTLINEKDVERFKPSAYSWSSKNVMPYETYEVLAATRDRVVIVKDKGFKEFNRRTNNTWQVAEQVNSWYIMLPKAIAKEPSQMENSPTDKGFVPPNEKLSETLQKK